MKNESMKKKASKLTLAKETIRQLDTLSREELGQVAGGGTTGYSPCGPTHYGTLYCSVGGGRGTCM